MKEKPKSYTVFTLCDDGGLSPDCETVEASDPQRALAEALENLRTDKEHTVYVWDFDRREMCGPWYVKPTVDWKVSRSKDL